MNVQVVEDLIGAVQGEVPDPGCTDSLDLGGTGNDLPPVNGHVFKIFKKIPSSGGILKFFESMLFMAEIDVVCQKRKWIDNSPG